MNNPSVLAVAIMTGLVMAIAGHTVKSQTYRKTTALKASLAILTGWAMVAVGMYYIVKYN